MKIHVSLTIRRWRLFEVARPPPLMRHLYSRLRLLTSTRIARRFPFDIIQIRNIRVSSATAVTFSHLERWKKNELNNVFSQTENGKRKRNDKQP